MRTRVLIAAPGIALGLFGIFRLLTQIPADDLLLLAVWLVAAVILHDGVLSPVVVGIGWLVSHVVPDRARTWVQGGLMVGGLVTLIALPFIHRQGSQPASKGILRQHYTTNLGIVLAVVLGVCVIGYGATLARPRLTNRRPPADHESSTE